MFEEANLGDKQKLRDSSMYEYQKESGWENQQCKSLQHSAPTMQKFIKS